MSFLVLVLSGVFIVVRCVWLVGVLKYFQDYAAHGLPGAIVLFRISAYIRDSYFQCIDCVEAIYSPS